MSTNPASDTATPTMARPAAKKAQAEKGLALDPKTGATTYTPPAKKVAAPKNNLRAAKKVNEAPPAKAKKEAKGEAADRLPARDAFRSAVLTYLSIINEPVTMDDIYTHIEKALKLTPAHKAIVLASGEATWRRHTRSADRQLRQAGLVAEGDTRGVRVITAEGTKA
jgi:hypothetical protein